MAVQGEIQIGRISRFFTKWLGTKGQSNQMMISGEIAGVIPLWSGVENRYLESWERFAATGSESAGGAGAFGSFRIRNPVGSGVIAVIELWSFTVQTLQDTSLLSASDVTQVDLSSLSGTGRLDSRTRPGATVIPSHQALVANALTTPRNLMSRSQQVNVNLDYILDVDQELTLLPGMTYQLACQVAQNAFVSSIVWRERAIEDSERT